MSLILGPISKEDYFCLVFTKESMIFNSNYALLNIFLFKYYAFSHIYIYANNNVLWVLHVFSSACLFSSDIVGFGPKFEGYFSKGRRSCSFSRTRKCPSFFISISDSIFSVLTGSISNFALFFAQQVLFFSGFSAKNMMHTKSLVLAAVYCIVKLLLFFGFLLFCRNFC